MKRITIELNQFKKLCRMCDFAIANRERFQAGAPAAEALPEMTATIGKLKELTASQSAAENHLRELSRVKGEARALLSADVAFLYHTARAIAVESPGFDAPFQLDFKTGARLLNAARTALQDAAPVADVFIRHAMPRDFLEKLRASILNFERAGEEYEQGKTVCSAGAAVLQEAMRQARAAATRFDAIIRNTLRADPPTLEAWKRVCRIPRIPRAMPDNPAPAPQPQAQSA